MELSSEGNAMFAIDEKAITEARRLAELGKVNESPVPLTGKEPEIFVFKQNKGMITLYDFVVGGEQYYIGIYAGRVD